MLDKSSNVLRSIMNLCRELPNEKTLYYIISNCYINACQRGLILQDENLYRAALGINDLIPESSKDGVKAFLDELDLNGLRNLVFKSLSETDFQRGTSCISSSEGIANLAYELLDINDGGHIIYDMGSGNGYFLANLMKKSFEKNHYLKDIFGQEINHNLAQISSMALEILNQNGTKPNIIASDIFERVNCPYTKGFTFPPFGVKGLINEETRSSKLFPEITFTNNNSSEWLFIDKLLSRISGQWTAVALVPSRALLNNADKEFRSKLIEQGYLAGIIELPNNSLPSIFIKTYMLVFSADNRTVKFVDASNVLGENKKNLNKAELPVKKILDLYNAKDVSIKNIDELKDVNNIIPSKVLLEIEPLKNGVALDEVAEVFTGNQYTLGIFEKKGMLSAVKTKNRILTSGDIEDDMIDWDNLKYIKYDDTKFNKYAIKKNDVIVASKSSKIKTTVVEIEPNETILVIGGMMIIRPNLSKLNPTYLKIFLDSQRGQQALKNIQKGEIIVTINSKDLAKISIPLISIEKQQEIADRYNEKLANLRTYKKEIMKLKDSIKSFADDALKGEIL